MGAITVSTYWPGFRMSISPVRYPCLTTTSEVLTKHATSITKLTRIPPYHLLSK